MSASLETLYYEITANVAGFLRGTAEATAAARELEATAAQATKGTEGAMAQLGARSDETERRFAQDSRAMGADAAAMASNVSAAHERTGKAAEDSSERFERASERSRGAFARAGTEITSMAGQFMPLAFGVAAVASLKMATDFETATTQLVTGAGESESAIDGIRQSLLRMAGEVGQAPTELAKGLYMIESAGYHGADALNVLRVAAEGAKVGQADMATMSNALTSALNSYHLPASSAVAVTDDLIAAVRVGKMHMEDLAGALGTVGPAAATAHIPLEQVTAAIATMTMQGTPAADAATYLRMTILHLEDATGPARKELESLGLSFQGIQQELATQGLPATLQTITDAIGVKFPASAQLFRDEMAKVAAGTLPMDQAISELQTAAPGAVAALANISGGAKGMQAVLELTGANLPVFAKNVESVAEASRHAGHDVEGWALIQKDAGQVFERTWAQLQASVIRVVDAALPALRGIAQFLGAVLPPLVDALVPLFTAVGDALQFIGDHQAVLVALTWPLVVLAGITMGVATALNHLGDIVKALGGFFADAGHDIGAFFHDLPGRILDALGEVGSTIEWFFRDLPGRILAALGDLFGTLVPKGAEALGGLLAGLAQKLPDVALFFVTLPARILAYLVGAEALLVLWGVHLLTGLWNGIVQGAQKVWDWFRALPGTIVGLVSTAGTWLLGTGVTLLTGLWNGIVQGAQAVWSFFTDLPGRILGFLTSFPGLLWNAGADLLWGLLHGIWAAWNDVTGFFGRIPGAVAGFFAGAGGWLVGAGRAILEGLLNGLRSAWGAVTDFVGGIAGWIRDHKGPIETDRVLLVDAGRAIMAGLHEGLLTGFAEVRQTVGGMSSRIADEFGAGALSASVSVTGVSAGSAVGAAALGAPVGGSGGSSPTIIQVGSVSITGVDNMEQLFEELRSFALTRARTQGYQLWGTLS